MFNNELWQKPAGGAGGAGFYTHQIANSCRFDGSSSELDRTPSSAGNRRTFTFSTWIKKVKNGAQQCFFSAGSGTFSDFEFDSSDRLSGHLANGGTSLQSTAVFRDPSAWYHFVVIMDTTQGTADDRCKVYINGERITAWNTDPASTISQNYDWDFNNSVKHAIGYEHTGRRYFAGYLADTYMVDGTAKAIGDCGTTKNGVWIPDDPSGFTFGTNGFYCKYEDSSNLGNDSTGGTDFDETGLSAHDQMLDSPTFNSSSNGGNFSTFNAVYRGDQSDDQHYGALTEGNLKMSFVSNGDCYRPATIKTPASGKWYFEYLINAGGGSAGYSPAMGIINPDVYTYADRGSDGSVGSIVYGNHQNKVYKDESVTGTYSGSRGSNGDVMGIAVDMDNGAFYVSKNGTFQTISGGSQGDPTSGASRTGAGATWTPASDYKSGMVALGAPTGGSVPIITANFGQEGTFAGEKTAGGNSDTNGYGNFFSAVPSGYSAMCSGNLSAAGADPAQEKQPVNNYFQAVTYTGTGANGRSLTTKLKASSFWGKNRTTGAATPTRWWNTTGNNFGTGAELYVQFDLAGYGASSSTYQGVSNPQDTSITIGNVGYINVNSSSYVAYLFGVAGAAVVTDTSGDIDSVRFTDADAGISIMDYTGSGTDGHTVPHGLGVKPSFVIIKNSTSSNSSAWRVWADAFGDYNDYAVLNTDAAWQTSGGIFTADPTTTMLPLASGATQNNSSQTYMAWVFANTEGMVKAGTYVGNGDGSDGTFVYTGFKPAFLLVKKTAQHSWRIQDNARDSYNPVFRVLKPQSNAPEDAYTDGTDYNDFLSNGFKVAVGGDTVNYNADGSTYVYLAFAENPFKYATAR